MTAAREPRDKIDSTTLASLAVLFDEMLDRRLRNLQLELRVSAPATVVSYDANTQRATIQLDLIPVAYTDDGEEPLDPIVIPGAFVAWPGGFGGYITTPLVPGDTGWVMFADRCVSLWYANGGPIDPINGRTHNLADAVFFPGVRNFTNRIAPPTSQAAVVLDGPQINIGVNATSPIALADMLHQYLVAAITAAPVAPTDGGAAFKAGLLSYLGANPFTAFAATKGKAE